MSKSNLFATFALATSLVGGAALAETLDQALVNAYLTNPTLNANRAALRANDEVVNQALSGYLPDVFLRAGLDSTRGESTNLDLDQDTASTSLDVRQNIYSGGNTQALVNQAEALVRADRSTLIAVEQNVFLDVVSAYTAVWQDRSVVELALNNEERLRRQLEATRVREQVGDIAYTDVAQSEARLARGTADVETARADLAASTAQYIAVVGDRPGELAEPQLVEGLPADLATAHAISAQNPSISAQINNVNAQRHAIDAAFSNLLPSLDLRGSVDLERRSEGTEETFRTGTIGLDLAIPLYQGGEFRSQVRQNRQLLDQQRNQLISVERDVRREVDASWDRLIAAGSARQSFETEIRANEIALEGVQAEANEGVRTVLDVLDAQQELFDSQVNFVRARREEILASYTLKSAIGMLTVTGLELEVDPYDSTAYYDQNRNRIFGLQEWANTVR
jgi:TolC family type I secretion outer membrane protein